jgi:hypothetical protein
MDDSPSALLNAKFFSKISFAKGLTAFPRLLKSLSIRESSFWPLELGMKKWMVLFLAAILTMGQLACKNESSENLPSAGEAALDRPEPTGSAVLEFISKRDDYRQWPLYPGKIVLSPGRHPHGSLLITYVSPNTLKALRNRTGRLPDGAILIKENYSRQKKLLSTTVMYRLEGYNPTGGDWFWLKISPNRLILEEGKVKECIECHRAVQNNDWIFSGSVE